MCRILTPFLFRVSSVLCSSRLDSDDRDTSNEKTWEF